MAKIAFKKRNFAFFNLVIVFQLLARDVTSTCFHGGEGGASETCPSKVHCITIFLCDRANFQG